MAALEQVTTAAREVLTHGITCFSWRVCPCHVCAFQGLGVSWGRRRVGGLINTDLCSSPQDVSAQNCANLSLVAVLISW
uniref:Uncharacterized protein n=1 Tax=Leersia perrieri TaxID=77586 RepID=A0A0D9XDS6_9ORYZ